MRAELPALQRGAVWRPVQVESLWDSIMRGFPIGSFMLMPYERALGHQDMLLASGPAADPTHMLLDGQQRATSIALGFYKPWASTNDNSAPAALWIDLGAPPTTERDFSFRLVTRAHPWGYPVSSERQRLELSQMREASAAFQKAQPKCVWTRRPPVEAGWPWESVAPVPVAVLIAAASVGTDAAALTDALDRILPHWREIRTRMSDNAIEAHVGSASTIAILRRLRQTLDRYCVPAQTVSNLLSRETIQADDDQIRPDPTETLFIRVNSGGTPLQGEELIYSIAKAIWPAAPSLIQKIRNRFFSEARATLLIARLATVEGGKVEAPAVPDVSRFRRLVHGTGSSIFRERMEGYLEHGAQPLFEQAHALLTGGSFGLPPMLAADLARGESGREVMFLLLRWIERLNSVGLRVDSLRIHQRAKAVGALTAISWFGRHPDRCVRKLWGALATTMPDELPNFFNRRNFSRCLELVNNQVPMLYLPPPDKLRAQFEARITKPRGADGAFSDPTSNFWSEWNWGRFVNQIHRDLGEWYDAVLPDVTDNDEEDQTLSARKVRDWDDFIGRLYHGRNLVLFAQRQALATWFEDFDPTDPDTIDEINRPWDMDHILPSFYVHGRQGIPRIIRDWHGSIGNLRAWPLDANRSDAEAAPRVKLDEINDATQAYGMRTACDLLAASFIPESDWDHWYGSTPDTDKWFPERYLALPEKHGECRKALIKAIINRTLALYVEWYEQMRIDSLMPKPAVLE